MVAGDDEEEATEVAAFAAAEMAAEKEIDAGNAEPAPRITIGAAFFVSATGISTPPLLLLSLLLLLLSLRDDLLLLPTGFSPLIQDDSSCLYKYDFKAKVLRHLLH